MLNKFTEEQYQKIVEIADEYQRHSDFGIIGDITQKSIGTEFFETKLVKEIIFSQNAEEIMAIFNPLTREWAHERFVEKEKRYYWSTKKKSKKGKPMTLFKSSGGIAQMTGTKHALTESEIREWGYNPEMFDKEEVD